MFSPVKTSKVYEQVIEQIKTMVQEGKLKRGERLPSERELVDMLNVSRTSIREAIRSLEVIGFIECRHGEGNFIKKDNQDTLLQPLSLMLLLKEYKPKDVLELRKILEVESVAIAAKKIGFAQLRELGAIKQILKTTKDIEVNARMDKEFHIKIARVSGNALTENLLSAINTLIDSFVKTPRGEFLLLDKQHEILGVQHQKIYDSLEKNDVAMAKKAMSEHLNYINNYILSNTLE